MALVRLRSLLLASGVAAMLTVGCGQGSPLSSPTAPTGALGSTAITSDDTALVSGVASVDEEFSTLGKGGGAKDKENDKGDKGKDRDDAEADDDDDDDGEEGHGRPGHRGELSGFVTAKGTDTLTVRGVTVLVSTTTVIRHGHRTLTMADINVGDHVQARGAMDGTTLVAAEIKVEDTGNDNDDQNKVELKGTVAGLTGTCPAVTFTIGTPATTVKTNSSTTFDDVTCATLANGAVVEVKGTKQTDGSILATSIEKEDGPDEVEGRVFELSGTCPTLTFKVGATAGTATKVTTSATTTFSGVTCTAIANGAKVEVEGTKQADGSIAASSVELD